MPLMETCNRVVYRVKIQPFNESHEKATAYYGLVNTLPVLSEAWESNFAIANYWNSNADWHYKQIYPDKVTPNTNFTLYPEIK